MKISPKYIAILLVIWCSSGVAQLGVPDFVIGAPPLKCIRIISHSCFVPDPAEQLDRSIVVGPFIKHKGNETGTIKLLCPLDKIEKPIMDVSILKMYYDTDGKPEEAYVFAKLRMVDGNGAINDIAVVDSRTSESTTINDHNMVAAESFFPAQLWFGDSWYGVPSFLPYEVGAPSGYFYWVHVEIYRSEARLAPKFTGVSLCGV